MPKRHHASGLVLIINLCLISSLFCLASTVAAQEGQQQNDGSRQIVAEEFTKSRVKPPTASSSSRPAGKRRRQTNAASAAKQPPRYKRVPTAKTQIASAPNTNSSNTSTTASTIPLSAAKVGITIWRLRPAKPSDGEARILVQENAKETQWTPERISATTELHINDRVRLSIEAPHNGYLYVVDREQYIDGSLGDPYLIFPTLRTNGGDNHVSPGKLVDLPAQMDNPNYFTLIPSPSREDQVAEVLSIIITTEPLENLQLANKPLKLSKSQVEKWEKQWETSVEQYELEGGVGQTWSKEEKEASAKGTGRYLTQEDPSPQTVYIVEGKNNKGLLVTVPLRYRR
jgi:predicted secreted protein